MRDSQRKLLKRFVQVNLRETILYDRFLLTFCNEFYNTKILYPKIYIAVWAFLNTSKPAQFDPKASLLLQLYLSQQHSGLNIRKLREPTNKSLFNSGYTLLVTNTIPLGAIEGVQ